MLLFKLSRFGRNAADVLSTLQVMQDFGVNLICVEDGIDSSKDAGKLMISVLSAVAEIANYEKQLRQSYSIKSRLIEEIDTLDPDDKHYIKRKADLDDRLYLMYDKIEDTESLLIEARAKKTAIEAEKLTADNIYKVLIYFDKLYAVMDEQERRQLMESLISEIQIFEERKPNGQWLKSIKFKLPIIEEDMEISLDNDAQVESVVLMERRK